MESRGPHDAGAPVDLMDTIAISDKSSSDNLDNWHSGNNIRNNRLLFFTVEYIEDNQARDYSKMLLPYEQVSFSPRASSPSLDFEHRVSPLDPNMSSTARYSPTPVQLPSVSYQNSIVVLQGPPSPLIIPTETSTRAHINYVPVEDNSVANTQQVDNVTDFVNNTNEEGLVNGGDLILMQGGNTDMGASTTPLILTNIPETEFALTRDFLVMHDDQLNNMINPLQHQNTEIIQEHIVPVSSNNEKSIDISQEITDNTEELLKNHVTKDLEDVDLRSTKRLTNKVTLWSEDDDVGKTDESMYEDVRTIADQPVPSRAIATLPGSYLMINKLSMGLDYGVYAKRHIRRRTQFGPVEGILCPYDGKPFDNLPLLYETNTGALLKVDVSNENTSNWMRFVRPALKYSEQNLIICQQNDGIVFLTTRDIAPKEELKAGPGPEYASRRNLSNLQPDDDDEKSSIEYNQDSESPELLSSQDDVNNDVKSSSPSSKKRRLSISSNKLLKVVDGQTLLYTCPNCPKVFPRSYSLKRHMLMHPDAKSPRYECPTCGETFLHPYNRNRHVKIFHSSGMREKENARQNITEWRCLTCSLAFDKASLLNIHSHVHGEGTGNINDVNQSYICPQCGNDLKTRHALMNHVSKHGRVKFTKSSTNITTVASHKCTTCYKRFATKIRLEQHYLVHGAEDQKPLPCNICHKRFMNNSALSCHLKTHRPDKQIFECPMCKQLFNQVLMLKEHIETHKNQDDTFTCPHCPRTFTKYSVIRKHIRAHHCERKHKCQFCVKRFPTIDKLRMHLLRHSDHREFHCANCEKQFKRKDKLKEHMMRMHNAQRREMEIVQSNNNNNNNNNNNQAKKFVPKVNPTDYNRFVYKCHQCLVGFKRRGMLVNHLAKRHPDVAPDSVPELNLPILRQTRDYYCQYCDKVYKSSSKRKAHIVKNHPGAALPPSNRQKEIDTSGLPNPTYSQTVGSVTTTPQSCQWCHKQYASKAKLLQHQRKKHSTLMEPASQVPRSRNRLPDNHSPTLNDNSFIMSDYLQTYDIDSDILKPKIIKISDDVDLISHNLQLAGPQFVRIRDIR